MILQETDPYVKICMKVWLLCEATVYEESSRPFPRTTLVKECSECATVCFEMVARLVSNAHDMGYVAFCALVHCRQCAFECAKYANEGDIHLCGEVCSACGDALQDITLFSLN